MWQAWQVQLQRPVQLQRQGQHQPQVPVLGVVLVTGLA